jgi:WD40 repeat protein
VVARVFLSHASEDRALADEVLSWLTEAGHEVFLDRNLQSGLVVGEAWEARLFERLRWADAVVALVTAAYVASPWCAAEVGIASYRGSRVLPLATEPQLVHPLLATRQYADASLDPVAARTAIAEALARVDAAGGRGWVDDRSPFPGLLPFTADLHRVFFGRGPEVDELAALVRSPAQRAGGGSLVVVGPSGCGKSSLVRAGLLPVIAAEPGWWTLPVFVPGPDPVAALARELTGTARRVGLGWELAEVRARLDTEGLTGLVEELLLGTPGGSDRRRLLVVVDQAEELLTLTPSGKRARFADLLSQALVGPVGVVATLRPEYLAQLAGSPELAALPARPFLLRPLRPETLPAVIEGPAELAGFGIDAELVARLVADTGTGDALPLLAFTLARLAEGARRGDQLSLGRYDELGGVQGALVGQADAALAEASAATGRREPEILAGLLRLVTVDEQGRPSRWRVPRQELPEPVRDELDAFVARRLLSTDTENGTVVYGVAHEAFLASWPPLAEAIAGAGTALRTRRAVEQAAAEWETDGQDPSKLWERGQLAAAVRDLGAHTAPAPQPTSQPATVTGTVEAPTGKLNIGRSIAAGSRPRHPRGSWRLGSRRVLVTSLKVDRRQRARITTILSVLLALALVAAGIAALQRRDALEQQRLATARQLISQAEATRDRDPRLALRLGVAAQHVHLDRETRVSLIHTLLSSPYAGTLTGQTGRPGAMTSVAFAPDGRTLASAQDDGTVLLWNLTAPDRLTQIGKPLTGHTQAVYEMAFAPDGRTLATASSDKTAILWDLTAPGGPARAWKQLTGHTGGVNSVAFAPNGRTLATASWDGTVLLWDLTARGGPARVGEPLAADVGAVLSVAFAPDGRSLATGNANGSATLWDLTAAGGPARVGEPLTGHRGRVWDVAFAPDGRILATAGGDRTVLLWDLAVPGTPVRVGQPLTGHTDEVYEAAFTPDGRTLATASADDTTILWDVTDRARPARLRKPLTGHTDAVFGVAFAPDGRTMATAGGDRTVLLWDLAAPGPPARVGNPLVGHTGAVYAVAFSPDGRTLATGSDDHTVRLWDLTGPGRPEQRGKPLTGHTNAVNEVAFAPDGRTLATASADGTVLLWDLTAPGGPARMGNPLTGHAGGVNSVAFATDGRTLATAGDDRTVLLWDLTAPGDPVRIGQPLTGHTDEVWAVAFAPDGHTLATASWDTTVLLWDLTVPGPPVRIGEPLTGHTGPVVSVAFAPNGRTLATASFDGTANLWDLTNPKRPARTGEALTGHSGWVSAVAFAPDGHSLVTAGDDNMVILWKLTSQARPAQGGEPLPGHSGPVWAVAFAPDGRTLATAGDDGVAILWDLTGLNSLLDHPVEQACQISGGGLDRAEWARYIPGLPYQDTCPG